MATIKVSGSGNVVAGRNIVISNGRVIVDGRPVDTNDKQISIVVEGSIETLTVDVCQHIEVRGAITGSVKTQSGDVRCGNVGGSVSTMSGDVDCGQVGGSVSTMSGDIRSR